MHGYLEFSDPPEHYTYPLTFPVKDWPKRNDPSFIGIFYSKCRIGQIYQSDHDQRIPGVYFRYVIYDFSPNKKIAFFAHSKSSFLISQNLLHSLDLTAYHLYSQIDSSNRQQQ